MAPQTREEIFQPRGHLIGAVRVQAMIAQADAPADGHPVQDAATASSAFQLNMKRAAMAPT